jgi:hypothetical protein
MGRVAVITAPNIGYRNTGMLTVDLAFESLRRRMDTAFDATWYTLHTPETVPLREGARHHFPVPLSSAGRAPRHTPRP